jgi:DNA-binding MarR family transcriptional regulator
MTTLTPRDRHILGCVPTVAISMATIQNAAEMGGTGRSQTKAVIGRLIAADFVEKESHRMGGYVQAFYRRTEAGQKALEETV